MNRIAGTELQVLRNFRNSLAIDVLRFVVCAFDPRSVESAVLALTDGDLLLEDVAVAAESTETIKRFAKRIVYKLKLDFAIVTEVNPKVAIVVASRQKSSIRITINVHVGIEVRPPTQWMRSADFAGYSSIEIEFPIVVGNLKLQKINVRNVFEIRHDVTARIVDASNISPVVEVAVDGNSGT